MSYNAADRTYDAGARLTEVANTAASGEQVGVRYTLAIDDQRIEALEETGQKWQYGYDGLKQLVTAKKTDTATSVVPPLDQSYSYDPMGNRRAYTEQGKSIAYQSNNTNQYVSTSETSAGSPVQNNSVYDKNGNLLTDGLRTYSWDAENQLIAVTPVAPAEGAARVEYTYDWRMRRTGKKSYTYANGAWSLATTSDFKYHEWNPIRETIASSVPSVTSVVKNYVWGNDLSGNLHGAGGVGGLLSMKVVGSINSQPSTDNYFYAYDGNGNVRALVKADAANPAASGVVEKYAYDGFGREIPSSVVSGLSSGLNPFRFSTKQLDAETGMNYYGYRFYASDAGRWINRDPIAEMGGFNVYGMVGNSLLSYVDINGLEFYFNKSEVPHAQIANFAPGANAYTGAESAPGLAIPKIATGSPDSVWSSGCCAEILSAADVDLRVKMLIPTDLIGTVYTQRGDGEMRAHEDRRYQVYKSAFEAYYRPVVLNGAAVGKCGKICRKKKGEASELMFKYLDDLRAESKRAYDAFVPNQQTNIGYESQRWRNPDNNFVNTSGGLRDNIFLPWVVFNPPSMNNVPCPQSDI